MPILICYRTNAYTQEWKRGHLRPGCSLWLMSACLAALWPPSFAVAATPEYITAEEPVAESAADARQAVTETFEKPVEKPSIFPGVAKALKDKPPFLRDTKLKAHVRSYYVDTRRDGAPDSAAWALGNTIFDYESGLWKGRLQTGAVLYTSQPLYAPDDKADTLLLAQGQKGFTVLGQAYLNIRALKDTYVRMGRLALDTP